MENIFFKKTDDEEMINKMHSQSIQPFKSKEKKNNSDDHKKCHQNNGNV